MATKKAKRPRSAKNRTLPPDAISLETMLASVQRELAQRAEHVMKEPHDYHARRGLQTLHTQRSQAWLALYAQAPERALAFAGTHGLRLPNAIGGAP